MSTGGLVCTQCGKVIDVRDSVLLGEGGWQHATCGGYTTPAPRAPRPRGTDARTSEALVNLLVRMLQVPPMSGQTHTQWIANRAANIAQVIAIEYGGDCRNCGAVPLREFDEITEPMAVAR
jgi:hypothetical protein